MVSDTREKTGKEAICTGVLVAKIGEEMGVITMIVNKGMMPGEIYLMNHCVLKIARSKIYWKSDDRRTRMGFREGFYGMRAITGTPSPQSSSSSSPSLSSLE